MTIIWPDIFLYHDPITRPPLTVVGLIINNVLVILNTIKKNDQTLIVQDKKIDFVFVAVFNMFAVSLTFIFL